MIKNCKELSQEEKSDDLLVDLLDKIYWIE